MRATLPPLVQAALAGADARVVDMHEERLRNGRGAAPGGVDRLAVLIGVSWVHRLLGRGMDVPAWYADQLSRLRPRGK